MLRDGRVVYLLARGEMLNLDPSRFVAGYNAVPTEIDDAVAREALGTLSTVQLD